LCLIVTAVQWDDRRGMNHSRVAVTPFAIYCSGGASRVLGFYAHERNRDAYAPRCVVYDGGQPEILGALQTLFGDRVVPFAPSPDEASRLHAATSAGIHRAMAAHGATALICFGQCILQGPIIDAYPRALINFHPSLLPAFPGLRAIDRALEAGVALLGNTAHLIDRGIDTGEVLAQSAMCREDYASYEDVLELQYPLLKLVLRDVLGLPVPASDVGAEIDHRRTPYLVPRRCRP